MAWPLALAIWVTLASGVYLALSRDVLRVVVGLALLGSAVNLVLLAAGRMVSAQPAVMARGETVLGDAANALPQALILTAIVIGFALLCLALVLVLQILRDGGTDDTLALRLAEPAPTESDRPALPAPGTDGDGR
ncbi:MAG: NADH-quinone oxidoreductase subunit K [Candidatus Binatia bacterium]